MPRVVVVGAGIGGLSTAYALTQEGVADVSVFERSLRLGGNIITDTIDGFVIDGGPDAWVASKPQAGELAKELGLGDDIVPTIEANRRVYIAYDGALHPLPEGLVLGVPTRIRPMVETHLFSWGAKARMALEPFVPRKDWSGDADESIGDFITRRLGSEITDRLAAPLLGGIFAGDASELSLRATFPMLMNAEKDHGSLVLSMRAARKAQAGKPSAGSAFFSLRSGLDALVAGLSRRLGEEKIHTGREVTRVTHTTLEERQAGCGRYRVEHGTGASETADHVVLAAPAHVSSTILRELSPSVSEALGRMQYVSTATCFLAMKREDVDHPLDASGFLVPRTLGRPILAATWVSSKWPDRAPPGHVLMRVFYGGAKGQEVLSQTDDELAKLAFDELARFLKLSGKPLFSRVYRFHKSNPQPKVGHLIQMASLREKLSAAPGLHVVGSGFDGVGISDCIKQGRAVAKVIAAIQSSPQTAP